MFLKLCQDVQTISGSVRLQVATVTFSIYLFIRNILSFTNSVNDAFALEL